MLTCTGLLLGALLLGCGGAGSNGGGESGGGGGGGGASDTTPPAAPNGLDATSADGAVELRWDAVTAGDLEGYNLYRSTSSFTSVDGRTPIVDPPLDKSQYEDTGGTNGTTYHYRVTAVDDSGNESPPSAEVEAAPLADPPTRP